MSDSKKILCEGCIYPLDIFCLILFNENSERPQALFSVVSLYDFIYLKVKQPRWGRVVFSSKRLSMIYKISKVEPVTSVNDVPYIKCTTRDNVGIVIWGNHPVGDRSIQTITSGALPVIVDLNPFELEASYKIQSELGAVISVPSDYELKFLMRPV